MNAVFVVGGLDVHVQPSGDRRFFLSATSRASGQRILLGVARWEPDETGFVLNFGGSDAYFPVGSALLETLVDKLHAVREWQRTRQRPDPRLGIIFTRDTASHEPHTSLADATRR